MSAHDFWLTQDKPDWRGICRAPRAVSAVLAGADLTPKFSPRIVSGFWLGTDVRTRWA